MAANKRNVQYETYPDDYAVVGVQETNSFMMEVFHQQHDLITFYAIVGVQQTDSFMMKVFHQQYDLITFSVVGEVR